jgi:hypothetical protein
MELKPVGRLLSPHRIDCARMDPDHGQCTCGQTSEQLVTLSNAKEAVRQARIDALSDALSTCKYTVADFDARADSPYSTDAGRSAHTSASVGAMQCQARIEGLLKIAKNAVP